ncbi:MAG: hypothetical protein PVJ72_16940 [Gammaproteobacteria bacterium]
MPSLSRTLLLPVFSFAVFCYCPPLLHAGELDIRWSNNKLSIKAKEVTLCELLDELAEKTNTKIRNDNKCDYPVNINVTNASFDGAIKKIFKKDSYVLVDDDNERKLLVFNRNTSQYDNTSGAPDQSMREPLYVQDPAQPDPAGFPGMQEYGQHPEEDSMDRDTLPPQTMDPNPEPLPYNTEPPVDSGTLENDIGEGEGEPTLQSP